LIFASFTGRSLKRVKAVDLANRHWMPVAEPAIT
jgi:hypothetical protein